MFESLGDVPEYTKISLSHFQQFFLCVNSISIPEPGDLLNFRISLIVSANRFSA